ncbi:hypothetical protein QWZ04_02115 [Vibrio tapetis subsp. quintayensis]|nr:hypothetical protein [Vibrio tapetis]MDN3679122.1 hypothetical protein [Vibrio tapetis subsp. quintayensis]
MTRGALFDEAENRLTAQMAILVYFTHKDAIIPSAEVTAMHKEKIENFLGKI